MARASWKPHRPLSFDRRLPAPSAEQRPRRACQPMHACTFTSARHVARCCARYPGIAASSARLAASPARRYSCRRHAVLRAHSSLSAGQIFVAPVVLRLASPAIARGRAQALDHACGPTMHRSPLAPRASRSGAFSLRLSHGPSGFLPSPVSRRLMANLCKSDSDTPSVSPSCVQPLGSSHSLSRQAFSSGKLSRLVF